MSHKDLGALVAGMPRVNPDVGYPISAEENFVAGSGPAFGFAGTSSSLHDIQIDNVDTAVLAALISKIPIDRRTAILAGLIAAGYGCAHLGSGRYSKFPINFPEHLIFAPNAVGGIDNQFDGTIGPKVASPTWMHIIAVGNFAEHGANYFEAQTPMGHIITMSGFDKMYVRGNTWVTPGTIIGTEGVKKYKADGTVLTEPNTHEDVRLHTLFPEGEQKYTESKSGLVRKVHNPHNQSATGSAFTPYDGRVRTYESITRDGKGRLVLIAQKNIGHHIGDVLNQAEAAGISYLGQVMLANKAMEFGLVKNEGFNRMLSGYFAWHGAQKADLFGIYPNPELGDDAYQTAKSNANLAEEFTPIAKAMHLADDNHSWDKVIEHSVEMEKLSPISDDISFLWGRARAYQSKGQNVKSVAHWLAGLGLADIKWGYEDFYGKKVGQFVTKNKFNWQAFENLRRLYTKMGMPSEASYFAGKVARLNYQGPK